MLEFEGVYMKYFLPHQKLITVSGPSEEKHLFKQILWLEYVMTQSEHFIQWAQNGGEVEGLPRMERNSNWMVTVMQRTMCLSFMAVIMMVSVFLRR